MDEPCSALDPFATCRIKVAALKQFIIWCLTEGQAFNEALGCVRLAPHVVSRATSAVDSMRQ